jgi:hypothetical protein
MRLISLSLILTLYFSHIESLSGQIKQKEHCLNLKEGIIIFCKQDTADRIPMDIVFIPFVVNKAESLAQNVSNCLKKQPVAYFMPFQNMRHTQRFLNSHLRKLGTIDTSQYLIKYRLRQAFNEIKLIDGKASAFPSISNSCINGCDIGISAGAIIFDETLIEHYKVEIGYSDTPIIKEFTLNINSGKSAVKYYEFSYSFSLGMSLSSIPIDLSNE